MTCFTIYDIGEAKILDFGLAKVASQASAAATETTLDHPDAPLLRQAKAEYAKLKYHLPRAQSFAMKLIALVNARTEWIGYRYRVSQDLAAAGYNTFYEVSYERAATRS